MQFFTGAMEAGSLTEAGSRIGEFAKRAREEQSFVQRTCVYSCEQKKAQPYLTHDGERLMLFDESRCHFSLSRIIVTILHFSYEFNIYAIPYKNVLGNLILSR